jgi:predicted AAA+ superfamily ATPase
MKRNAMEQLLVWKNKPGRKPLVIRGARQVGKTWLMKEFGRTCFAKTAYVNFDNNRAMRSLFDGDFDIDRLVLALQIESGVKIEPGNTLLIFDEIQEVPQALSALKYFCENAPQYPIVAAGSLLGIAMHPGTSFPVGKVEELPLYPLSYLEFLDALGQEALIDLLHRRDWPLITAFKDKYIRALRHYYYVGGMPEAVASFVQNQDFAQVRAIQEGLLTAYEHDFSKHAPNSVVPRIRLIWQSIPSQLAKENRKFVYGQLREGARAKDFEEALQWLMDCGLLHKVSRVAKPGIPLRAYQDMRAFKVYLHDVGLLAAMSGIDVRSLLEGNRIFAEFKGALTEQYVLQQLISQCGLTPFYWSAEGSAGEVDFLFQQGGRVTALEVKAEENLRAKSLRAFCQKYPQVRSLRASMSNYRLEDWVENIPLYGLCAIQE